MRALTAEGPQFAETLDKMPGCPRCSDPARIASTSGHEPNEPPHIHVERDDLSAKFWLNPVQLVGQLWISRAPVARDTFDGEGFASPVSGDME